MNTAIWGPPLWRILHGISATFTPDTKMDLELIDTFIHNLQAVLPCVFCRNSLQHFLDHRMPDIKTYAVEGRLDEWMYDLHNLVNNKLNKQLSEKLGIPEEFHDILLQSGKISLDIVRKRALVAENRLFSILDVETVLCIIALNCSEIPNDDGVVVASRKCSAFSAFLVTFSALLTKTGMTQNRLDVRLTAVAPRVAMCDKPDDVLRLLLEVTSSGLTDFEKSRARFELARAKACSTVTKTCR